MNKIGAFFSTANQFVRENAGTKDAAFYAQILSSETVESLLNNLT